MPSLNNRALLMEITAFVSENNIRQAALLMATNTKASTGSVTDRSIYLEANTSDTVIECIPGNKATMLKTTAGPVTVNAKLGASTTFTEFVIDSVMVLTTPITALQISNPGSSGIQLRFLQV